MKSSASVLCRAVPFVANSFRFDISRLVKTLSCIVCVEDSILNVIVGMPGKEVKRTVVRLYVIKEAVKENLEVSKSSRRISALNKGVGYEVEATATVTAYFEALRCFDATS